MRIAVIPARGGSKRIPRKNVKVFAGKPMISWSIAAAQASGVFDRVIVSTDDEDVAAIAKQHGAEVPFMRPANLADDHTPTVPVIAHAQQWVAEHWGAPSAVCCIYATAPFVRAEDLREACELLSGSDADYVFPVTSFPFPIQRGVRLTDDGRMEMFWPEHALTRSQDLEEAYHDAGQFYWGRPEAWLGGHMLFGAGSIPLIVPRHRVQDIDTMEDWTTAEAKFYALQNLG